MMAPPTTTPDATAVTANWTLCDENASGNQLVMAKNELKRIVTRPIIYVHLPRRCKMEVCGAKTRSHSRSGIFTHSVTRQSTSNSPQKCENSGKYRFILLNDNHCSDRNVDHLQCRNPSRAFSTACNKPMHRIPCLRPRHSPWTTTMATHRLALAVAQAHD